MPNYQDYLDMYSGIIPGERRQSLDSASQAREEELRRITDPTEAYRIASETARGVIRDDASELERDIRTMSSSQLALKYGQDVVDRVRLSQVNASAAQEGNRRAQDDRSWVETAIDSASSAAQAIVGGFGGLAAWGAGEIDPEAGMVLSNVTRALNDVIGAPQSAGLEAARYDLGMQANAARARNQRDYEDSDQTWWDAAQREAINAFDVAGIAIRNPTILGDVTSQAAGSLLGGGILARGLRSVGQKALARGSKAAVTVGAAGSTTAGRAFSAAERGIDAAAFPLAIGLQEGGVAYTQTMDEALSLLAERNDLNDEQKIEIANTAATLAAHIQAPVGVITGRLVAKIEANPFAAGSFGEYLLNAAKETMEESIQSGTARAAQNYALGQEIDPGRELSQGVGEDVAYGAIGGFGAAGVMGGPAATVNSAKNVTTALARAAGTAIMERGERLSNAVSGAVSEAPASIQDTLTNAFSNMPARAQQAVSALKAVVGNASLSDDQKSRVSAFADRVASVASDIDFGVVTRLSEMAKSATASMQERMAATLKLSEIKAGITSINNENIENPTDVVENSELKGVIDYLNQLNELSDVNDAIAEAETVAKNTVVSPNEVENPDNTLPIAAALGVAEFAPENANPETNAVILKHADDGKINLTPAQRQTLQSSSVLAQTLVKHDTKQAELAKTNRQVVSRAIEDDGVTSFKAVVASMRQGSIEEAKARAEDLRMFGEFLQNKVAALNEHARLGTGDKKDAVRYLNLIGDFGSRRWIPSEQGLFVNRKAPKTVAFARGVENDAKAIATLVNNLAVIFPELGIEPLPEAKLELEPVSAPVEQVYPEAAATISAPAEIVQANPAEGVDKALEVTEEIGDESASVGTTEETVTTEAAETAQPKGGDTSTDVDVSNADSIEESQEQTETPQPVEQETTGEPVQTGEADTVSESEGTVEQFTVTEQEETVEIVKPFSQLLSDLFSKAFKIPDQPKTRIAQDDAPVLSVRNALKSVEALTQYLGKAPRLVLSDELIAAYDQYLSKDGRAVGEAMIKQLNGFLDKNTYGGIRDLVLKGEEGTKKDGSKVNLFTMVNAKALNLVQIEDGEIISYDPTALGGAVLAGLQWALQTERLTATSTDRETVAEMFGIDLGHPALTDLYNKVNLGIGATEVKRSLAAQIIRYWGVTPNSKTDLALINGITESMAGEVIEAMIAAGIVKTDVASLTNEQGLPAEMGKKKEVYRYSVVREKVENLMGWSSLIEETVLIDGETSYIGTPPSKPAQTQMNDRRAKNTSKGMSALEHENNTPYRFDMTMFDAYEALSDAGVSFLFGGGLIDNLKLNRNVRATLEGQNITFLGALGVIRDTMAEVKTVAQSTGQEADSVPVYFAHNFSSIGRMQQLGRHSPQASKLTREVLLPTWSTLDLTDLNGSGFKWFSLALAQALGIKVHTMSLEASQEAVFDLLGGGLEGETAQMAPAVTMLRQWLKTKKPFTPDQIDTIAQALGSENTPLAFHALVEYARFVNAEEAGELSEFKTSLYVEADGVTNGPVNAIAMLTPSQFDEAWVANMGKGGLFFSDITMNMNRHRSERDKVDLYETMAGHLTSHLSSLFINLMGENQTVSEQMSHMLNLMNMLKPKDFQKLSSTEWTISRSVTKNPLTITLYGSGEKGIAGNILEELTDAIYQRISDANELMAEDRNMTFAEAMFGKEATDEVSAQQLLDKFSSTVNALLMNRVYQGRGKLELSRSSNNAIDFSKITRENFTFTPSQVDSMRDNILHLFVKPMSFAIEDTVGKKVIETIKNLRIATQVQTIFMEGAFKREVERALSKKSEGEFLSQDEINAILDSLSYMSPAVETGEQVFNLGATEKADVPLKEFGRPFSDGLRTNAFINGVADIGVKAIPTMVVGMGDGFMQQFWANMENSIAGTLKIFDGTNIPLSSIEEGSRQANEAAFRSWLNNPLSFISENFAGFLSEANLSNLDENQRAKLVRALFDYKEIKKKPPTKEMVKERLSEVKEALRFQAMSITARQNVLKRVKVSVDQMASTGVTYQNDGDIDLSGLSNKQVSQVLNQFYHEELVKMIDKGDDITELSGEIAPYAELDEESGAQVISAAGLGNILAASKLPRDQKNLLTDTVRALKADGYKVVIGVPWRLQQWANAQGLNTEDLEQNAHGLTKPADKIIYITSREVSSETLVHELLHAATFEQVLAYYSGQMVGSSKAEQGRAIERMEVLMGQFLSMGEDLGEVGPETQMAYENAVAAIENWINSPNHSEAVRKAAALNEFMAWGLSNQNLIKTLKRTKATSLAQIASDILAALKRLIWGNGYAPAKVWQDMHSNLRFNTLLLMETRPTVQNVLANITLFHSNNQSDQVKKIGAIFRDKMVQYLDNEFANDDDRGLKMQQAISVAIDAADKFMANGFRFTAEESETFRNVVAAMAVNAELDPNVFLEAQKLYAHVTENLKPSDFMADPSSTDPNELSLAQSKYDVVVGNFPSRKDAQNRSAMLSGFLALSMTNESFRQALAKISVPSTKLAEWNTLDNVLENVGIVAMDKLSALMSGADRNAPNVQAAMNALTGRLIANASMAEQGVVARSLDLISSTVNTANDFVVTAMERMSDAGVSLSKKSQAYTNSKLAKRMLELTEIMSALITEKNSKGVSQDLMSRINQSKLPKWSSELMNEFVGRTDENAPVYDMIKLVRSWVQQTRQTFREQLPRILEGKFTKPLTDEQHKVLFYGMGRTDLATLISTRMMTERQALELLQNPDTVSNEVAKLEAELTNLNPKLAPLWFKKGDELADFMVSRKVSTHQLRNAHAVANLLGVRGRPKNYQSTSDIVEKVDVLISLYALQKLPEGTKKTLKQLATDEAEGVGFSLAYLVGQRRGELNKNRGFGKALLNHYKGYIPSDSKQGNTLKIAPVKDKEKLRRLGYEMVKPYETSQADPTGVKLAYYFSTVGSKGAYSQGIIQNIRHTYSGVDPITGFTNNDLTGGQIIDAQAVDDIIKTKVSPNDKGHPLMPIFDDDGFISAYERSIDPEMDALLERNTSLTENIGIWRGRQAEEHQAGVFNSRLIARLGDIWSEQSATRSSEFVNVFDSKVLKADPVLADAVSLLNRETLDMAKRRFPKDTFMVRKDMLNDVFGYRAASLGDVWTGNSRWSPQTQKNVRNLLTGILGEDAYRKVVKAEEFWQNFIVDARVTIVVKSIIVPAANLLSNVFQLLSRGVPITAILKGMPKKTAEIDAFVKNRLRRVELEAELRAAANDSAKARVLKNEIQSILDANRRMSIWPLIEAGEFNSISDVGISRDEVLLSEGRLSAYMEKLTSKLPDSMKTLGRYGILSRDTALFKGLQRAVEYGDFLGKAVLYDHLMSQDKTQAEALAQITEEFVNYDRLAGRSRSYLENIGLLWFWNFKIRSTKIALSIIRNNPLHAMLALSGPIATDLTSVGSPLYDNAPAVWMDGRAGWSIGPNMAIHAYGLNPWYNVVT